MAKLSALDGVADICGDGLGTSDGAVNCAPVHARFGRCVCGEFGRTPRGDTGRVFVLVDSSFPMESVWDQVGDELDEIDDQRFSEFALATEKARVHSWSDDLRLGAVTPFAPCGFDDVAGYTEIGEADNLILITYSMVMAAMHGSKRS